MHSHVIQDQDEMSFKIYLSIIGMLLLISCIEEKQNSQPFEAKKPKIFSSQIHNRSLKLTDQNGILEASSILFGIYKGVDSIDISEPNQIEIQKRIRNSSISSKDSFDVNGFEIAIDYEQTIFYDQLKDHRRSPNYHSYFPLFIINSSKQDKLFIQQEDELDVVQEAQHPNQIHEYYAITFLPIFGTRDIGILIRPNEYLLYFIPKFQGGITTELRLRYKTGNSTIVTKPFKGQINLNQFNTDQNAYLNDKIIKDGCDAVPWLFLDAKFKCDK